MNMQPTTSLFENATPITSATTEDTNAMSLNFKPYNYKDLRAGALAHLDWPRWASLNSTNAAAVTKVDLVRFHLEHFTNNMNFTVFMDEALAKTATEDGSLRSTEEEAATTETPKEEEEEPPKMATEAPKPPKAPTMPPKMDAATPDAAQRLAAALADMMSNSAPKPMELDADQIRAIVKAEVDKAAAEALKGFARVQITILDQTTNAKRQIEGLTHKSLPALLKACSAVDCAGNHLNVWMHGPAGSGKTHAAAQVAKALNLPFGFHGSMSMPHELVGFVDAAGTYHTTQFVKRFTQGGVCLLDEVDSGENAPLLALQAALANGDMSLPNGEIVKRHKDFICIAAGNTTGQGATVDYVGRSKIDGAFLSRFPILISWDYDEELEQAFSGNKDFAKTVQKAREKAKKLGLKVLITPRHTAAGAALIAAGATHNEAAQATYLSALNAEQARLMNQGA